jgi:hypothetical protein
MSRPPDVKKLHMPGNDTTRLKERITGIIRQRFLPFME